MEVRKGYKQTEVGVIPEDWDVDTLASTTPRNMRNSIVDGPFGSNLKTIHYRKSGIPIITSGYVTEGYFLADDYLYVDDEKFKQEKRSAVNAGDIVMAKIGARCGASAILPEWHQTGILSGNALKITIDKSRHSTYYIWQKLWSLYLRGTIESLKTTGAQPAISMANLKKFKIPLPPLPEQNIIAAALSDANALIDNLGKLIAKKRNIKQGTIQLLLTARKRLPGFTGEWETKALGDIFSVSAGGDLIKGSFSPNLDGNYLYPIYSNSLANRGLYGYSSQYRYDENCITVTARGTIGAANARDHKFDAIGRLLVLRPMCEMSCFFIAEYINHRISFSIESTGVPQLTAPQISKYEIDFPKLEEQTAIAQLPAKTHWIVLLFQNPCPQGHGF